MTASRVSTLMVLLGLVWLFGCGAEASEVASGPVDGSSEHAPKVRVKPGEDAGFWRLDIELPETLPDDAKPKELTWSTPGESHTVQYHPSVFPLYIPLAMGPASVAVTLVDDRGKSYSRSVELK